MFGQVEKIGGSRQIQVAVRVEAATELVGMVFKIGFHGEANTERIIDRFVRGGRALAPEALAPLMLEPETLGRALGEALFADGEVLAAVRAAQSLDVSSSVIANAPDSASRKHDTKLMTKAR